MTTKKGEEMEDVVRGERIGGKVWPKEKSGWQKRKSGRETDKRR